jgi:DNA polymerase-3 subunit gamma/tau
MYIIDEVHMLSKPAFNALLKTLEEPPEHVKFLLATTEVDKVPVTVLSRCQRFDLRRIPAEKLADHFAYVAEAENVAVEREALAMIARAAEGSARDGLSILDQAIAHGGGQVSAEQVRDMLGLADRGRIRRLLDLVLAGDAAQALAELDEAHDLGIDPAGLLRGLMEVLHSVTRTKAGAAPDALSSVEQRQAAEEVAQRLSWSQIHRLWQLLLKGLQDVQVAPDPQEAASMALLRLIHAAELPDPATLMRKLSAEAGSVAASSTAPASSAPATAASLPADFRALVVAVEQSGKHLLAQQLHDHVGLVNFAPPQLALKPMRPLGPDFARDLALALKSISGATWRVTLSDSPSEPSLLDQEKIAEERARDAVLADPNVQAVLEAFPEAALESFVSTRGA